MTEYFTDVLTEIAVTAPGLEVYTFLSPGEDEKSVTAGQLYRDAGWFAGMFADYGIVPGDIVILSFAHGYDVVAAFWGALYQGALPTVYPYFPENHSPAVYLEKLKKVARAAGARAVVSASPFSRAIGPVFEDSEVRCICLTPPESLATGHFKRRNVPGGNGKVAYIQFSSGTTGIPKGVLLTHDALVHYMEITKDALACTPDDVTVGWLPLYHDMGLITQMLHPLYCRQRSVLINPADWLADPGILFKAIDRYGGTISWMPNFAFNYCTRQIKKDQVDGLDLSSWRILGCGSEPVQIEALEAFKKRFKAFGFKPDALKIAYGLAEHVAGVTLTPHDGTLEVDWVEKKALGDLKAIPAAPNAPESIPVMSCGYPKPTVLIRIVGNGMYRKDREVGEVLLKSPSLFSGYHRADAENNDSLRDGWLYTGDLGYVVDGQLYIVGRKKDLIIAGGNNIQPGYIESIAESILGKACRYSAAFGIYDTDLGSEKPVLVCEMRDMPDDEEAAGFRQQIRGLVKDALAAFIADIYLVKPGWIIKTTSGKISRSDTREKYLSEQENGHTHSFMTGTPAASPIITSMDIETVRCELTGIWKKLFRMDAVSTEDNFFELGGNSLLAIQLVQAIEDRFGCRVPVVSLFELPTISGLAGNIISGGQAVVDDIMVSIHPGNDACGRPRFFCVHGIRGGVLGYRSLAVALGEHQPFYAIQAPGVTRAIRTEERVEDIAAGYIRAVKKVQPSGPYYIGGYCFGGVVAYEMGRQLAAAGDEVALLAVIEGYPPSHAPPQNKPIDEWVFAIHFIRNLPYWIREYMQLSREQRRHRSRRLVSVTWKRLLRLIGVPVILDKKDIVDNIGSVPAHYQHVIENNIRAINQYRPGPYGGRMVLLRTPHRIPGRLEQPDRGWGDLADGVDIKMIPGSHTNILNAPNVQILADRLTPYLNPPAGNG